LTTLKVIDNQSI